jgi:class 3 adenylate cyclase
MAREKQERAVLFADISESGVLYQTLGDAAARNIVTACIETIKGVLPAYKGELVKTLGDAVMCTFPNADLAVGAASDMQSAITKTPPAAHPIGIHIGLHFGPVLVEDGDVFGDTVNVAAYLTAVATREQILTTEATEATLSPQLKTNVRAVFHTVLKSTGRASVVYQVIWKDDPLATTELNANLERLIPGDPGSLLVALGNKRIRIGQWQPSIQIGRESECDLVVTDRYASRVHVTMFARGTRFYLRDQSINGTFVRLKDSEEVYVLREEMLLDRSGELSLGRSRAQNPDDVITFEYDRRSMFRI